jgi:hypothetical protein
MSSVVAHLSRNGPPDPNVVKRAAAAAPNRGRHAEMVVHGACVLGVTLDEGEDRQGVLHDRDLAIAYAGSFDNLGELVERLRTDGTPVPGGATEPAILLAAFRQYGDATPALLRGAYAVVIADGRRLLCFRDHLGLATLFRRSDSAGFWVASVARQVVAASGIPREPDLDVLEAIFYGPVTDATGASLAGVSRIPKATLITFDGQSSGDTRYWLPENLLERAQFTDEELAARFDQLMGKAVGRLLQPEAFLALSGGIDSPTVAAFAAPQYLRQFDTPLTAFSQIYPDFPASDESRYIEEVVARFGMRLQTHQPSPADQGLGRLAEWTDLLDGPWSGPWVPGIDESRYRRVRELGARRLITGDFAEFVIDFDRHIVTHLLTHGRLRSLAVRLRNERRSARAIARELFSIAMPSRLIETWRHAHPGVPGPPWINADRIVRYGYSEVPARQRWRRQQLTAFSGPGIGLEAYRAVQETMGVQVRSAWGDIDLWEMFLSLPAEQKFPGRRRKELIRRMMRGRVPDSVLDRSDSTGLNAFMRAGFDYGSLCRWINAGDFRMPGIDYPRLRRELERGHMSTIDYMWAKDLAGVHAFVSLW